MIGVFLALDLFLFYIFWEVVLVPMYLIIGIWGGSNRIYATIKFVLYTLVGSLLMLVAILATAFAYQAAHPATGWAGAFDFETLRLFAASPEGGFSAALQLGAFLAFFLAFAIKVPMFPFHTWLPDAHTEAPTAGLGDPGRDHAEARRVRAHPIRGPALPRRGPDVRAGDHRPVAHRDHLRRDRRARPAGPETARGVLIGQPHGLRDPRPLRLHPAGRPGRGPPDDQPRDHHRRPVPPRRRHLRADPRPHDREDGRPRGQDARLRGGLRVLRVRLGRAPGPVRVRRGVPDPGRHVRGEPRRPRRSPPS